MTQRQEVQEGCPGNPPQTCFPSDDLCVAVGDSGRKRPEAPGLEHGKLFLRPYPELNKQQLLVENLFPKQASIPRWSLSGHTRSAPVP